MDFNPDFSFDFAEQDAVEAPWEFGKALRQAEQGNAKGTSIDFKIKQQMERAKQIKKGRQPARPADSDDDGDDSGDDSEDQSLPGEVSEDEVDSEDQLAEDESELEEEDDDSEEEERPAKGKQQQKRQANGAVKDANKKPDKKFFDATPKGTSFTAKSFSDLNLSRPLVRACEALGYTNPTPIQAACIPLALTGRDICGSAMTGSGKTAAFGLPLLERLLHRNKRLAATYVLILAPARELAVQVHSMLEKLAKFTDIKIALVVGGLSLNQQAVALRDAPEIVVATPGRMIDHLRNSQGVGLEDLQALVLDEADRLLEMGFKDEIQEIVRNAPSQRQTLLFSATMTEEVKALASLSLRHPVRLAADAASQAPSKLAQEIVRVKGSAELKKEAALLALCSRSVSNGRAIVFFKTKQRAHRAKILFGLASLPTAVELHGDMTQSARLESLERFRKGEAAFLLATDVAARGLDILGVETVINYDCPKNLEGYLHRIGRTARAGAGGKSITFVEDGDRAILKDIMKKTKAQLHQRQIAPPTVNSWYKKIDELEIDIRKVLQAEREEKELRQAEMQATKASNMIEHQDEIYSRPARTWFMSLKEKKELSERSKEASENPNKDNKGIKRMERKQAALKEANDAKRKRNNNLTEETAAITKKIKQVKAREHALRREGVPAGQAGRMAASLVTGGDKKKKNSSKKKGNKNDGGLFTGDGIEGSGPGGAINTKLPSKVYAGGAKSQPLKPNRSSLSKVELNRVKRHGKGNKAFKSKARHKRR